ncbi:MAG: branched-chain amino acid ABC transporter permease [Nitrospirae bacterium]|nr:branched-chain amino acid ABC transporter permease [Nitrospirota bacterium]
MLALGVYVTLSTGQLTLGSAGFMGIGAYTTAVLTVNCHVPVPVGIVAGGLLAGVAGVATGFPALRLRGVYLAVATLGLGEMLRVVFIRWEVLTGGAVGFTGIPQMGRETLDMLNTYGLNPQGIGLKDNEFTAFSVFLILLLIAILTVWAILRQSSSRVGRAFSAIECDESAAGAMGIDIHYYKVLAFGEGAFISGLAGALYAHTASYISPADFTYHRAVEVLAFAVLGGIETAWGAVIGAAVLTVLPETLRFISSYRYVVYGIILVAAMVYRPQGLIDRALLRRFTAK